MKEKPSIPKVLFKSNDVSIEGVEIILLEDLANKVGTLNHNPEKAHQLSFNLIVYYTEGATEHLVDFKWYPVKKGSLIFLSKGQVNAYKFNSSVKGYMILFTEEYFNTQLPSLPANTIFRLFTPHLYSPLVQIPKESNFKTYTDLMFHEFYNTQYSFNKVNLINHLYNIIFSKLEDLKIEQTDHIKESNSLTIILKFKSLLDSHFRESRNASYYANLLLISYKQLNVICKEIIGKTAKQFIDDYIVLEAKRYLINSTIKSTELAYLLGFEESTNFVKYFKKHTGFTPNKFKKMYL